MAKACTVGHLIYLLAHKYTEAHLQFDHLKGNDRNRAEALITACKDADFVCYLCTVEKSVEGGVSGMGSDDGYVYSSHHAIEDINEEGFKLAEVVTMKGQTLVSDIAVEEENVIQLDRFEDRDPDDENFEGWTGNEGANTTHWFRDTGILIMPKEDAVHWLVDSGADSPGICDLIDADLEKLDAGASDDIKDEIIQRCRKAATNFHDATCTSLKVKTGLGLGRLPVVTEAAKLLLPGRSTSEMLEHLAEASAKYTFTELKDVMDVMIGHAETIADRVKKLSKFAAISRFSSDEDREQLLEWREGKLNDVLSQVTTVTGRDAMPLVQTLCEHQNGTWLEEHLSPSLQGFGGELSFILQVAQHLRNAVVEWKLPLALARQACQDAIETLLAHSALSGAERSPASSASVQNKLHMLETEMDRIRQKTYKTWLSAAANEERLRKEPPQDDEYWCLAKEQLQLVESNVGLLPRLNPYTTCEPQKLPPAPRCARRIAILRNTDLPDLHRILLDVKLPDIIQELMGKVRKESATANTDVFDTVLLPYLREVLLLMKTDNVPLDSTEHRALFVGVLEHYILRWVQREPTKPTSWAQPARISSCPCLECLDLERFLQSYQRVGRFSVNGDRRNHLESMLPGGYAHSNAPDAMFMTHMEKSRTLFTLVLTKTHNGFERNQRAWQRRKDEACSKMHQYLGGDDDLRVLFGNRFEDLVNFELLQQPISTQTGSRTPLATVANPPGAGTAIDGEAVAEKRKRHEEVDVCDEPRTKRPATTKVVDLSGSPWS